LCQGSAPGLIQKFGIAALIASPHATQVTCLDQIAEIPTLSGPQARCGLFRRDAEFAANSRHHSAVDDPV
jgi:hypothetical protein